MTGREIALYIKQWLDSEGFESSLKDGRLHPDQYADEEEELDQEAEFLMFILTRIDRVADELDSLQDSLDRLISLTLKS